MSKTVASIARAALILKCLSEGIDRISKISKEVGLSVSTTHRLLKTLQNEGFVEQDPLTLRYYLGSFIAALASVPQLSHQSLIIASAERMQHLRGLTGETVALVIRQGIQRIQLEELPGFHDLKYSVGRGFAAPLYAGATGKVLLSQFPDEIVQKILDSSDFSPIGPNTITDRRKLQTAVRRARKEGFSTSFGEIVSGAASLAVPICNYITPAAMCILAPESRLSEEKMKKILPEIIAAANEISKKLRSDRILIN